MHHPEIYQVAGGKKHLAQKDGEIYCCGLLVAKEGGLIFTRQYRGYSYPDKFLGRLLTELDLDESFCQRCVRSFWKREATK